MSLTPLLILPGVALLIMSTSVRYTRVHDELHHVFDHAITGVSVDSLVRRARLLRNALVLCYMCVFTLTLAGLLNVLEVGSFSLMAAGVTMLLGASGTLCLEALASFRIFEEEAAHFSESRLARPHDEQGHAHP